MKQVHIVLLGLLLVIGATCDCVAGQHRSRVTLLLCGNASQESQKNLLLQQTNKRFGTIRDQQKIRRLRNQRDSLSRIIRTLEQQRTSNTQKKLAKLRSERDLISKKIIQLTKVAEEKKGEEKKRKSQLSNKAISKKQQPTQRSQKSIPTGAVTTPPKKNSDKIEKIISKLDAKEKRKAKADPPVTGESRKPTATQPKKNPTTPLRTPVPETSTSGTAPATTRTMTMPSNTSAPVMLRWPVDSRKILLEYGERYNPQTNTVTINPGINIRVDDDGEVSSAESGDVSMVTWMPGYRTVVIVDHGGGCRTVYANLSSTSVKRGSKLRRGDKIGTVSKSKEGRYLHFQVWKERQRMNPITMLR